MLKTNKCRMYDFMMFVGRMIAATFQAKQPHRQQEKVKFETQLTTLGEPYVFQKNGLSFRTSFNVFNIRPNRLTQK